MLIFTKAMQIEYVLLTHSESFTTRSSQITIITALVSNIMSVVVAESAQNGPKNKFKLELFVCVCVHLFLSLSLSLSLSLFNFEIIIIIIIIIIHRCNTSGCKANSPNILCVCVRVSFNMYRIKRTRTGA